MHKEQDNNSISEINALKKNAHPQIQAYILQLEKEVGRLRLALAKQEVSNLSAFHKLKAEFEVQKKEAANIAVHFVSPDERKEKGNE